MTLIYQKTERKKEKAGELDHNASLKHMNQKLNLIHLFNVFFLSIVSVIYIVAYTIYCQMYHMSVTVNFGCLLMLSVILCFFYKLSQHEHQYLYIISIIVIPIILISSMYWMAWTEPSQEIRTSQWLFIVIHSMVYIGCIFNKEKILIIRRRIKSEDTRFREEEFYSILGGRILCKNCFLLMFPVIILILYIVVGRLPLAIDRLPANEAYNYIDMICADTDIDADSMIERVKELKIYNETNDSYDIRGFMRFLAEELGEQLLEKKIIKEEKDIPTRKALEDVYMNMPRYRSEAGM